MKRDQAVGEAGIRRFDEIARRRGIFGQDGHCLERSGSVMAVIPFMPLGNSTPPNGGGGCWAGEMVERIVDTDAARNDAAQHHFTSAVLSLKQ